MKKILIIASFIFNIKIAIAQEASGTRYTFKYNETSIDNIFVVEQSNKFYINGAIKNNNFNSISVDKFNTENNIIICFKYKEIEEEPIYDEHGLITGHEKVAIKFIIIINELENTINIKQITEGKHIQHTTSWDGVITSIKKY